MRVANLQRLLEIWLVSAILGCGGASPTVANPAGPAAVDATPRAVLGFTSQAPSQVYASETSFALAATDQIYVVADWADVSATQSEELTLLEPNGHVYYSTSIPFTGALGSDRSVTTLPDGTVRATFVFEIAGTPVESYQLTGTWTVLLTLEGGSPGTSTAFELY